MLGFSAKKTRPSIVGLVDVQRSGALLAKHQATVRSIKSTIGVPEKHWRLLYLPLFEAFAEFVQSLPASEAHHHCDEGGHLRHGLEMVDLALRLRRGHVLPPGKEPEEVAEEQDVWTYAVASAALLHDVGKPLVDQSVTLYGRDGLPMCVWSPWVGSMVSTGAKHYKVEFRRGRDYRLHEAVSPLLAPFLIPKDAMRWLAQHRDALAAWVNAMGGKTVGASVIAEVVKEADRLSVGRDLSGQRHQVSTARAKPLAERLVVELRQLLDNGTLPLNRKGAAAFVENGTIWLVSKRCLDAVRESMKAQGQTGIPSRNDRLMDELQQRGIAIATADERAVWTCEVIVGDGEEAWRQELTMLRVSIDEVWPVRDARPQVPPATVTPREEAIAAGEQPSEREVPTVSDEGLSKLGGVDRPGRQEPTLGSELVAAGDKAPIDDGQTVELDDLEESVGPELEAVGEDEEPQQEAGADLGREFVAWLTDGLTEGRLAINTAKARVHVVEEGLLLVSPAIFRTFAGKRWLKAQKRFLKQKMTARTSNGENIFHYDVNGDRGKKTIKGILINNPEEKLAVKLPQPNSILSAKIEA